MQKEILASVEKHAAELTELARRVHACPELAMEEFKAVEWQTALLKKWKWKLRRNYAGMPTAYRADWGKGSPVFCFMAEYDALPGLGHGCGHNLICAAALGAGQALREALERSGRDGTVVVMGTPGEEGSGGKVHIVNRTKLKGIDAALMAHPSYRTVPDLGGLAICRLDVIFTGKASHAAASPELGINALDAVMLLFHGVNAWRQHLPETARIHGVVTDGGVKPNIVPERAACSFYVRAADEKTHAKMVRRFRDIAKGAALMTGAKAKVTQMETPYKSRKPNRLLNQAYLEATKELGMHPVVPSRGGRGSTDFGDVSQMVPGAHVYFGIAKKETPAHSPEFAAAAAGALGRKNMLNAAAAMAETGWRFLTDSAFRAAVKADFKQGGECETGGCLL